MPRKIKVDMVVTTFRLPVATKARMDDHDFVNWSAVVRDLLDQKLDQIDNERWTGNLGEKNE